MAATIVVPTLLDIASRYGLPVLRTVLRRELGSSGEVVSDVTETVLKTVAGHAGVTPDKLSELPEAALAEAAVFAETSPEVIEAYAKYQKEVNRLLLAPMEADKPTWTWAWLPAWQWFLMALWSFTWVIVPIANAAFRSNIPVPNVTDLANLTLAYLALHMGGHTVKDFVSKKWGSR